MKTGFQTITLLLAFTLLIASAHHLHSQGTAFTYQGRLNDGANPATGVYDLRFAICDAASAGNTVGLPLTNSAVVVTNGLFTITLDFGTVFDGADRWLAISVRTNGGTSFVTLSPRQRLTPTPYSVYAANAGTAATATSANNIGNVSSANIAQLNVLGTTAQATGVPVITDGFITRANVTYGGIGYVTAPAVTVSDLTGSNAVIMATVSNGAVVGFTVWDAGRGYSSGATLTVELPPSNAYQTVTAANYFTGINTMTNPNNVFVGTFTGKGALPWQIVSGTSCQAQANTGYLLTNNALVTITLPSAPSIGDVVRISGSGAGGWKTVQNAGQFVLAGNLTSWAAWKPHGSSQPWGSVTSSADGTKLVAVANGEKIYTSTDSGVTWTRQAGSPITNWISVASSSDGTNLVAVVAGGQIYTSTDSGVTWTPRDSNRQWLSVTSSADGIKLVAAVLNGQIYTSTDSGATWMPRDTTRSWWSVASSADGTKLVAAVGEGQIYTSTDSGATWTPRDTSRDWQSVASSADGTKLVAADGGGHIYASTDSGATWTPRAAILFLTAVASSADGTKLVAASSSQISTSIDSGVTWSQLIISPDQSWQSIASSADGTKLVAVPSDGQIYTYTSESSSGTAGYLVGSQSAAIELQYIGNGQFLPLSWAGTILAY